MRNDQQNAYGPAFWLCYLANTALMVGVSVLFRYADFVRYLDGTDMQLGLIVGTGMTGALLMRVVQAVGIDRYGPRRVWLLSLVLFIASMLGHLGIERVDGAGIYLLRIMLMTSLAGAFGASITYISLRVPETRMAEMIGTLGSSGFIGIALGPVLGDWLFDVELITRREVDRMFLVAAGMGGVSLACTALATWRDVRVTPREVPALGRLVRRYHPGMLLLVAVAMGLGVGLPHTFLRTYTAELGIGRIQTFFLVYAATAFVVRIGTRRWTDRRGVRPVVLLGLSCLGLSMVLYLAVVHEWLLALPAVLAGVAHAFLFPAVVAGGSLSFPRRYRGVATTLMLAMFDLGNLVGQPAIGSLLHLARRLGLPAYPTMFLTVAALLALVALAYARWSVAHAAEQPAASRTTGPVDQLAEHPSGSWPKS